jgi:DNA-binding MarR family transcriptional regulator
MNHYITRDTPIPGYLIFPRVLLRSELTSAEQRVYMLLLDRSRLSLQNDKWIDGEGRAFLSFPILELAEAIGRSDTAVKNALRGLEEKDLISRERRGMGRPSRIYAKLPGDGKEASSPEGKAPSPAESRDASPLYGKEASSPWARRLPANKNYRNKTKESSLPKGPTAEEYERMKRFLEKLEKQAEENRRVSS